MALSFVGTVINGLLFISITQIHQSANLDQPPFCCQWDTVSQQNNSYKKPLSVFSHLCCISSGSFCFLLWSTGDWELMLRDGGLLSLICSFPPSGSALPRSVFLHFALRFWNQTCIKRIKGKTIKLNHQLKLENGCISWHIGSLHPFILFIECSFITMANCFCQHNSICIFFWHITDIIFYIIYYIFLSC